MNPEITPEFCMGVAIDEARSSGWPFGAVIFAGEEMLAAAGTSGEPDPTAHAEVNVIRKACGLLQIETLDGKDAIIYTTCEPCVMCMGAIWNAGIRRVVYGTTLAEMERFFPENHHLTLPEEDWLKLTDGKLVIAGGLLKDRVMHLYEEHPDRVQ